MGRLDTIVLLSTCILSFSDCYFQYSPSSYSYFHFKSPSNERSYWPRRSPAAFRSPPGWTEDWEPVSSVFSPAPPSKLEVRWRSSRLVQPGDTIPVTVMTERPAQMRWGSEFGSLYTVMLLDAGISRLLPKMYVHWMMTNIPGNNINNGVEVMRYVTPFSLEFDDNGEFITDPDKSSHPLILAVFKQKSGKIVVDEAQAGCTPDIIEEEGRRIVDYKAMESKYSLELVAGNYLYMPYSGYATHDMICRISQCTGQQWPFPIPGINDREECQARQDIVDISTFGPKRGYEKIYNKYVSEFSPDGLVHIVKDTQPTISTGKARLYTAIEGAFGGVPGNVNNLDETLDGVLDAVFFNYHNKSIAETIFYEWVVPEPTVFPSPNKNPPVERLTPLLQNAYFPPFSIVLITPDDQDFDVENIAEAPGWVFDVQMVQVNEGQEEQFQELRKKVKARMLNIKDVEKFHTFTVDRDILQDPRAGLGVRETERIEVQMATHKSRAARQRSLMEIITYTEFQQWTQTFKCIACGLMKDITRPEYFPPYNV